MPERDTGKVRNLNAVKIGKKRNVRVENKGVLERGDKRNAHRTRGEGRGKDR